MSITIDTITYGLPLETISRKVDPLFKSGERMSDGTFRGELIGVFFNHVLAVGRSSNNAVDYDALFDKITEPVINHSIILPFTRNTTITFDCYFANISDEVMKWELDGTTYFRKLTFSPIAISPARVPA